MSHYMKVIGETSNNIKYVMKTEPTAPEDHSDKPTDRSSQTYSTKEIEGKGGLKKSSIIPNIDIIKKLDDKKKRKKITFISDK